MSEAKGSAAATGCVVGCTAGWLVCGGGAIPPGTRCARAPVAGGGEPKPPRGAPPSGAPPTNAAGWAGGATPIVAGIVAGIVACMVGGMAGIAVDIVAGMAAGIGLGDALEA